MYLEINGNIIYTHRKMTKIKDPKKIKTCFELMDKVPLKLETTSQSFNFSKGKRSASIDLVYCILPNGEEGYRIEYIFDNKDFMFPEDLGTLIFSRKTKKWHIINW